jgi:hypothetical protein
MATFLHCSTTVTDGHRALPYPRSLKGADRRTLYKSGRIALVVSQLLCAGACGSSTSTSVTNPASPTTTTRCQVNAASSTSSFTPAGGVGTISIGVARECAWNATSQASWIVITSAANGQGDGTLTYRVAENADPVARNGVVAVADSQVALTQQAAPCRYDVGVNTDTVPSVGADLSVSVHTHPVCDWTAKSEVAWAAVSPEAGRGDGAVHVVVSANGGAPRPVTLVVAGAPVSAMQRAGETAPVPTPTPPPLPPSPPPPTPPPPAPPPPTPPPPPPPPPPEPPPPTPVKSIQISGKAGAISGTCPTITFLLKEREVYTTPDTDFREIACAKISKGTDLEIQGMEMSDNRIRADRVNKR